MNATDQLFSLNDKTALVTGASSGLGERFCEVLAAAGARVIICARRRIQIEKVAERIRTNGGSAEPLVLDVCDREKATAVLQHIESRFGDIDILVNNAGIAHPKSFESLTESDWQQVMDVNLNSVFRMSRLLADHMIQRKIAGSIINIASVLGFAAQPTQAAYASSKGGVLQLTRAMALDLVRYRIRVNAIAPGYILTDINREFFETAAGAAMVKRIPMRRVGTTTELDGTLLLLASDASAYMTGSVLTIDGGIRARL